VRIAALSVRLGSPAASRREIGCERPDANSSPRSRLVDDVDKLI
jgi:hypothetical protein